MGFYRFAACGFHYNTSFKSYGVICLPLLPSTLLEELSVDRRNSNEFFKDEECAY